MLLYLYAAATAPDDRCWRSFPVEELVGVAAVSRVASLADIAKKGWNSGLRLAQVSKQLAPDIRAGLRQALLRSVVDSIDRVRILVTCHHQHHSSCPLLHVLRWPCIVWWHLHVEKSFVTTGAEFPAVAGLGVGATGSVGSTEHHHCSLHRCGRQG